MVNVGYKAEPQMRVGVVKDQAIFLAFCCSQSATDNLYKQDLGFGRSRKDDAAHIPINARRQAPDVAHHAHPAAVELPL